MKANFFKLLAALGVFALLLTVSSGGASHVPQRVPDVKIGNYHSDAPYGIAFIVDDETGFLIDPVWDE